MYKCEFSKSFKKDLKKLHKEIQNIVLNKWIILISRDPLIGKKFKSDNLKGVYRVKFRFKKCDYRIIYYFEKKILRIFFIAVGPRENFYKRLESRF